jgi:hypothetical protein
MLIKYIKSIEWITKNEAKMSPNILRDFERFEAEFDAWAAARPVADQNCIESTIKAVRMVLKVFPKAKILQCQE